MPDKILDKIIKAILKVVKPDKIILFGSRARGDARIDSDYDILVVKSGIKPEEERLIAQDIYVSLVGIKVGVDIIVKTPESIEKSKNKFISVVKEAINEGITIYG